MVIGENGVNGLNRSTNQTQKKLSEKDFAIIPHQLITANIVTATTEKLKKSLHVG